MIALVVAQLVSIEPGSLAEYFPLPVLHAHRLEKRVKTFSVYFRNGCRIEVRADYFRYEEHGDEYGFFLATSGHPATNDAKVAVVAKCEILWIFDKKQGEWTSGP